MPFAGSQPNQVGLKLCEARKELVILDEAERLNTIALNYLRDLLDREDMVSFELACQALRSVWPAYPQLYNRSGLADR